MSPYEEALTDAAASVVLSADDPEADAASEELELPVAEPHAASDSVMPTVSKRAIAFFIISSSSLP